MVGTSLTIPEQNGSKDTSFIGQLLALKLPTSVGRLCLSLQSRIAQYASSYISAVIHGVQQHLTTRWDTRYAMTMWREGISFLDKGTHLSSRKHQFVRTWNAE